MNIETQLYDYYRKGNRLIKVQGDTLIRDITPDSKHPISDKELKKAFEKWQEAETDTGAFEFIASYDFFLDNDLFMKMYNSFNTFKSKQKRTAITPELIEKMKRYSKSGDSNYSIAKRFNLSPSTVSKYLVE